MLTDTADYRGFWWLPGHEDQVAAGEFHYSPADGLRLTLTRLYKDAGPSLGAQTQAIILGLSHSGLPITLERCIASHTQTGLTGIAIETYVITRAYIGAHFDRREDILLDAATFSLSGLQWWSGVTGLARQIEFDSQHRVQAYGARYVPPEDIRIDIGDGRALLVGATSPAQVDHSFSFALNETGYVRIESPGTPLSYEELHRLAVVFRDLVSLGLGQTCAILDVTASAPTAVHQLPDDRSVPVSIKVLYAPRVSPAPEPKRPQSIAFRLRDLEPDPTTFLRRWYRIYLEAESPMRLYFATLETRDLLLDQRFMYLIEAFESLHRFRYGGTYMDRSLYLSTVYPLLVAAIPTTLDSSFVSSIRNRLKYHYQFSLRRRIEHFVSGHAAQLGSAIPDVAVFAAAVADTRNHLAHRDEDLKSAALQGAQLLEATRKLSEVVGTLVLELAKAKR